MSLMNRDVRNLLAERLQANANARRRESQTRSAFNLAGEATGTGRPEWRHPIALAGDSAPLVKLMPWINRTDAPTLQPMTYERPAGAENAARSLLHEASHASLASPQPKAPPEPYTVVFGGGGEPYLGKGFSPAKTYADKIGAQYVSHLGHLSDDEMEAIFKEANGRPVRFVGHSWGGPKAYRSADRYSKMYGEIELHTIDPVGLRKHEPLSPFVDWTNVDARRRDRKEMDFSDHLAELGGTKGGSSRLPIDRAGMNLRVDTSHANFEQMLNYALGRRWPEQKAKIPPPLF